MIVTLHQQSLHWMQKYPRTVTCAGHGAAVRNGPSTALLVDFAAMLARRGIRVDRLTGINHALTATTPDFHTESQFGCIPQRDILLTVESKMLQATMRCRCRWFEYLNYRPLMQR